MQRFLLTLVLAAGVVLLAACSPSGSGSAFALVGAPTKASFTDSANFLISGNTCNYYTYRGDGTTPPEAAKGCTVMEDKANALGHAHAFVKIGFDTPKGEQVLTLTQAGNNTLSAASVPDIGMYLPNNWTVTTPAADMVLDSTAAGSAYSNVAVHADGVRCSMTVTPVSNNTPVSMPCGLVYWGSGSISVAVPGALISTESTSQSWTLHFSRNSDQPGAWNLAKPIWGFPASFTEAAATVSK